MATNKTEAKPRSALRHLPTILFLIVAFYLTANTIVIDACYDRYILDQPSAICDITDVFKVLRDIAPFIYKPAGQLEALDDLARAELVVSLFSFALGTFILLVGMMFIVGYLQVKLLSDDAIREHAEFERVSKRERDYERAFLTRQIENRHGNNTWRSHANVNMNYGKYLLFCLGLVIFSFTYFGYFMFYKYIRVLAVDDNQLWIKEFYEGVSNVGLSMPAIHLSFVMCSLIVFIFANASQQLLRRIDV